MNDSPSPQATLEKVRELLKYRPVCGEITWPDKYHSDGRLTFPSEKGDCRTVDYANHMYKNFPQIAESYEQLHKDCCVMWEALGDIQEHCGCQNSSSFNQMKDGNNGALELSEQALSQVPSYKKS